MGKAHGIAPPRPRAHLVETIPSGLDEPNPGAATGESTAAALVRLVDRDWDADAALPLGG